MLDQNSPQRLSEAPGSPKNTGSCTCQETDGMVYCEACRDYFAKPLENKDLAELDKQR